MGEAPSQQETWLREALARTPIEGAWGVRYYVHDVLGAGGQGWVFRAHYDEPDGFWVVVKVLRPDVVGTETLKRFVEEAAVLRKLGQAPAPSPNIVRFYDNGVVRVAPSGGGAMLSLPFTVLEYVEGPSLATLLARTPGRGLSVVRVRKLFRQVARALHQLHASHVVHRDLRPSNLLIAEEGGYEVAKVSDFGLVKRFDTESSPHYASTGLSVGYAPPEQYEKGNPRVSERTDVYAFAVTLFEALSGRPCFELRPGETPLHIYPRVVAGSRPRLAELPPEALAPSLAARPALVKVLDTTLDQALHPDPAQRHGSLSALWEQLEPILRAAENEPGHVETTLRGKTKSLGQMSAVGRSWHTIVPRAPEPLRLAVSSPDGGLLAVGRSAVFCRRDGAWAPLPVAPALRVDYVRVALATADGMVVAGQRGLLGELKADGSFYSWAAPDPTLTWAAGSISAGEVVVLGQRAGERVAFLGRRAAGQSLEMRRLEGVGRLRAVARLPLGSLLACGTDGSLVHITSAGADELPWVRTGGLTAIALAPHGGAFVVGTGGHALSLSSTLIAKLEPVQTTRDLTTVAVMPDGGAWAGADGGRLVWRTASGWLRVPLPEEARGTVLLIEQQGALRVVFDDGLVLEADPAGRARNFAPDAETLAEP